MRFRELKRRFRDAWDDPVDAGATQWLLRKMLKRRPKKTMRVLFEGFPLSAVLLLDEIFATQATHLRAIAEALSAEESA